MSKNVEIKIEKKLKTQNMAEIKKFVNVE